MARETKVGLLAGLAFIVCFAVILANRGRNGPPGLSDLVITDASATVPAAVQRTSAPIGNPRSAQPADGRRAESPSSPPRSTVLHQASPGSTRSADSTPASGAELPNERNPVIDANRETLDRLLASRAQPLPAVQPDRLAANGPATQAANSGPNAQPFRGGQPGQIDPRGDARPAVGATGQPARDPRADPNERAAPRGREYTVKSSDTLSSIAAANYGSKSRNAVNAIFDANRGVLSDPDHLKVGTVLLLPTATSDDRGQSSDQTAAQPTESAVDPLKAVAPREKRAAAESAPSAESAATRWYQVKKNDRYASIARDQLGDAGRWKELYDLNKDKFPDPQRIREGVRIKLPVMVAEGRRENRR